jgi:hypothetical protein
VEREIGRHVGRPLLVDKVPPVASPGKDAPRLLGSGEEVGEVLALEAPWGQAHTLESLRRLVNRFRMGAGPLASSQFILSNRFWGLISEKYCGG